MASGRCVPHKQAAHMAAPTEGHNIKKTLANGEPSTHGPKQTFSSLQHEAKELRLCAAHVRKINQNSQGSSIVPRG
jgi:hypothetical protein